MIAKIQAALIQFIKQQTSSEIYSFVPPNAVFPYIYIDKVTSKDWSSKTWKGFDINFKLNIYDKNTTNIRAVELSFALNQCIPELSFNIPGLRLIKTISKDSETVFNKTNNLYLSTLYVNLLIIKE